MWITALIFVILVLFDQLTKHFASLQTSEVVVIPNVLSSKYSLNSGAAFGMGSNMTWLWVVVSLVATILLAYVAYKNDWKHGKFGAIGVTMAFAGAFGNLIDRFLTLINVRGGVIDMISFKWFDWFLGLFGGSSNVFNVADVLLIIGLIFFAIDAIFLYERRVRKYGIKNRRK